MPERRINMQQLRVDATVLVALAWLPPSTAPACVLAMHNHVKHHGGSSKNTCQDLATPIKRTSCAIGKPGRISAIDALALAASFREPCIGFSWALAVAPAACVIIGAPAVAMLMFLSACCGTISCSTQDARYGGLCACSLCGCNWPSWTIRSRKYSIQCSGISSTKVTPLADEPLATTRN